MHSLEGYVALNVMFHYFRYCLGVTRKGLGETSMENVVEKKEIK